MNKSRLEAFSDGVLAIIITIMVLELRAPTSTEWKDLEPVLRIFVSYILSFVFIGIYWGNHHHLLHTLHYVNSKIIWANLHLLFWLSLIPFTTRWMGEVGLDKLPVMAYAINLFCSGIAFSILQKTIMAQTKDSTKLMEALKKQEKKAKLSTVLYIISIISALFFPFVSVLLFATVSILWMMPDKDIERALKDN